MEFTILFYAALLLFAGLLFGRAVKIIKLPNVTGYLIAGLILGPYCFKIFPLGFITGMELMSEIALAFIAFSIGAEFKVSYLKKVGILPGVIAIFEATLSMVFVTSALLIFRFPLAPALLLGAIASATAPAATIMVIKEYKAKGPVTDTLLSVVALDDAVALITFGFALAVVNLLNNTGPDRSLFVSLAVPLLDIINSLGFGIFLGYLFVIPLHFFKEKSNRLIITIAFVFFGTSIASILNLSPLLLCMSMGATLINKSKSAESIFKLADSVTAPIYLMFFVVSGAELDISILPKIGMVGLIYIVSRVVGKVLGASIGATIMKAPKVVKKYIGFALIPQAGVAIGLMLVAAKALPEFSQTIRAVVLSATLVYELIGPISTKIALTKAKEISKTP
jgi:Kef-type K+ transport system membrane component KefB